MCKAKTSLVVLFLLLVSGCFSADLHGPVQKPPVADRLISPLVNTAERLADATPDRNYVRLLEIGDEALLVRIHLIRSARRSIEIQTMIWANDEAGRLIMYELIQAARRGVKVRLLIDHVASEQHIEVANFLGYINPNFEIRLYNPMTGVFGKLKADPHFLDKLNSAVFKFDRTNRRMHNKTFIIDDRIGITGGRNYQNAYYDQARGLNFKDRDILVVGPVAAEMKQSFDKYWEFKRSVRLTDLVDVRAHQKKGNYRDWNSRRSFELNGIFEAVDDEANRSEIITERFVDTLQPVDAARFVADDPGQTSWSAIRGNGHSEVTEELAAMVSRADDSVYIQTPYLILTSRGIRMFRELRRKNPEIDMRISTNSLAATDSWYVYALSYKQKKLMLSGLGFRIYEFKPLPGDLETFMPNYVELKARALAAHREEVEKQAAEFPVGEETPLIGDGAKPVREPETPYFCLHGKSIVVDDAVSFVGSYNLDPRSENINTECGLILEDAAFARQLKDCIIADMRPQNSWVIARKNLPDGIDEANAALVTLSSLVPFVDLWPFRYSASFELKNGREAVEPDHPDFYENYRDVGSFPKVRGKDIGKEIGVHGTKTFLGVFKPLL